MADTPAPAPAVRPPAPKPADWVMPIESSVNMALVNRARTRSAGFVVSESPRPVRRVEEGPAAWRRLERRLWMVAGTLMVLAAGVLGAFGVLTLGGSRATAVIAAAPAAAAAPVEATPAPKPVVAEAKSTVSHARPVEKQPVRSAKRSRHHKSAKQLRGRNR